MAAGGWEEERGTRQKEVAEQAGKPLQEAGTAQSPSQQPRRPASGQPLEYLEGFCTAGVPCLRQQTCCSPHCAYVYQNGT